MSSCAQYYYVYVCNLHDTNLSGNYTTGTSAKPPLSTFQEISIYILPYTGTTIFLSTIQGPSSFEHLSKMANFLRQWEPYQQYLRRGRLDLPLPPYETVSIFTI